MGKRESTKADVHLFDSAGKRLRSEGQIAGSDVQSPPVAVKVDAEVDNVSWATGNSVTRGESHLWGQQIGCMRPSWVQFYQVRSSRPVQSRRDGGADVPPAHKNDMHRTRK